VVVLIHGGFWKAPYTKLLMTRLARSVAASGWAAWNIEYRRLGRLGGGGGWPATFADVAAAIDHLARLDGLDTDRVVTCGHSAGGHLALWAAGRARHGTDGPGGAAVVPVRGVVSLAGVADLTHAARGGGGAGAVRDLMGGGPDEVPDRYRMGSPAARLPFGVPQVLVHGLADTTVPPSMSERYVLAAREAGDPATYVPIEGVAHRQMLDPGDPSWAVALDHLGRLLG